jgi:hypothetical protein
MEYTFFKTISCFRDFRRKCCMRLSNLPCLLHTPPITTLYGSTALMDLRHIFSFSIYTQSAGLLGQGISPSQCPYLHTEQTHTDIHGSSGIWTHEPSFRVGEDGSCLRPRAHCDRLLHKINILKNLVNFFVGYVSSYITHSRMLGWLMNHKSERIQKEAVIA